MKLKHDSPAGTLDIPGVGRVPRGKPFTVDASTGRRLLEQHHLFREIKPASSKKTTPAAPAAPASDKGDTK